MSVRITIRNIPEAVRDELARRAAAQHESMQEFLLAELGRLASKPSVDQWLARVRKRKSASGSRLSAGEILVHRDADRK
jgi:hypothetical protein